MFDIFLSMHNQLRIVQPLFVMPTQSVINADTVEL